jgi:hypothetical protein
MEPMDPRLKAGAAWGGVGVSKFLEAIGIGSWGDFYSLLLIGEWVWKKWRARMRKE